MRKLLKKTEFYLVLIIAAFCIIVEFRSGQFFTGNNIVDLPRSLTIPAMFALGEMMVLISGGVDVSFPAIASLSMFVSCYELSSVVDNPWIFFIAAMLIGLGLGAINGLIIAYFRFPPMIVTLGTSSICFGVLQGVFHAREYPLVDSMIRLGKAKLFTATNAELGISSDLPFVTLAMAILLIIGWLIMSRTMLGRGIYAIGGDVTAAKRAGFNVFGTQMFIYCFSGCMAGMIGVFRATMLQAIHPTNLTGIEMTVIAACVIGGVKITGGKGNVLGALLGTVLLTVISNSLILLGIDTKWQSFFIGLIIIIGTAVSALQAKSSKRIRA